MRLGLVALVLAVFAAPAQAASGDLRYFRTYPEMTSGGFAATLNAAAVQPDGKVVVAGRATQNQSGSDADWVVARIDPVTGALDGTFGQGGVVRIAPSAGLDRANAVAIGPGGRVVVAGNVQSSGFHMAVAALKANGEPDPAFGGIHTFSFGSIDGANAVIVDPSTGAVTLGGEADGSPPGFGIVRLDAGGQPLADFGTAGKLVTPVGGSDLDGVGALLPAADGTIIAVGTADQTFDDADLAFARYDASGLVGTAKVAAAANRDRAVAAVLAGDKIVVGDFGRNAQLAPLASTRAFTTAFDPVAGYGGETFGFPSFYNGLAAGPDGTVYGLGTAQFGGALDDFQLATLGANGQPAGVVRNYPGTADKEEIAGALAYVPATSGSPAGGTAVMAGSQENAPAVGAVDQGGGTTPPPPPTSATYDLAVTFAQKIYKPPWGSPVLKADSAGALQVPFYRYGFRPPVYVPSHNLTLQATITNDGPLASPATAVTVDSSMPGSAIGPGELYPFVHPCHSAPSPYDVKPFWFVHKDDFGGSRFLYPTVVKGASIECDVPALAPGETYEYPRFSVHMDQFAPLKRGGIYADIACAAPAENFICANNKAEVQLVPFPDPTGGPYASATIEKAGAGQVSGDGIAAGGASQSRASIARARAKIKRIEVAILRLGRPNLAVVARARADCAWVKNAKPATRKRRAIDGACVGPVWLRAKGTRHWRFSLRKRLPAGTYQALARAIDSRGRAQDAFGPPNVRHFAVKKRRVRYRRR